MRYTPCKSRNTNPYDFFTTPANATLALVSVESFPTPIWECACGDGDIAKCFRPQDVICTDLRDYGNPDERADIDYTWFQQYAKSGVDFLKASVHVPSILTNPPYYCLEPFIAKVFQCATQKVALLMDNRFLACRRYQRFYDNGHLKVIYCLQHRLRFRKERHTALWGHHWAVWDMSYCGRPTITLLDNKVFAERRTSDV